jgi:hypothetical protein
VRRGCAIALPFRAEGVLDLEQVMRAREHVRPRPTLRPCVGSELKAERPARAVLMARPPGFRVLWFDPGGHLRELVRVDPVSVKIDAA